jgi:hypothetical protein
MKNQIKTLSFILLTVLLTACATSSNYQLMLNHWQGRSTHELIHAWGYPNGGVQSANGNVVYFYTKRHFYTVSPPLAQSVNYLNVSGTPIYSSAFTGGVAGPTTLLYCNTWFEVNWQGIIVGSQFEGNGCVASSLHRWIP